MPAQEIINIQAQFDSRQALQGISIFNKNIQNLDKTVSDSINNVSKNFNSIKDSVVKVAFESKNNFNKIQDSIDEVNTSNFNSELETSKTKVTTLSNSISDLSKEATLSDSAIEKASNSIKDLGLESNTTTKALDKIKDKLEDTSDQAQKTASLGLEALKDSLGSIPLIGPTATRALDGIDGSLKSVIKSMGAAVVAAGPVLIAIGAIAAIGSTFYGAYKNSVELQNSLKGLGQAFLTAFEPVNSILEVVGDNLASLVNYVTNAINKINALSGSTTKAIAKDRDEINKATVDIANSYNKQIAAIKELGLSKEVEAKKVKELEDAKYRAISDNGQASIEKLKELRAVQLDTIKEQEQKLAEHIEKSKNIFTKLYHEKKIEETTKAIKKSKEELVKIEKSIKDQTDLTRVAIEKTTVVENKAIETTKANMKSLDNIKIKGLETTEAIKDPVAELQNTFDSAITKANNYIEFIKTSNKTELEKADEIRKTRLQALEEQKYALIEFKKEYGSAYDDKALQSVGAIDEQTGELIKTNTKLVDSYNQIENAISKTTKNTKMTLGEILNHTNSIIGSINNVIGDSFSIAESFMAQKQENYDAYNTHIYEAEEALAEYQKSLQEEDDELSQEEYEKKINYLQSEMEKAIQAGDAMAANAIKTRMEELKAEQKAKEEEKKIAKEREDTEKKLNNNIALAEYNKEKAIWDNQVKQAETSKKMAIAQGVTQAALGTAMAFVGQATSFAQGGLVGLAAGIAAAAATIASVTSAVAGINSATQEYEAIKSSPPQAPQGFAVGTGGYTLGQGQSAIVGELGAETLTNIGNGRIQVDTARQTSYDNSTSTGNTIIQNLNVIVEGITNKYDLIESLKTITESDLVGAMA